MRYLFILLFLHSIVLAQVIPVEIVKSGKGYKLLETEHHTILMVWVGSNI